MIASRTRTRASQVTPVPHGPLPMMPPGRRCSVCRSPLSRYNRDPKDRCNACKVAESAKRLAAVSGPVATHELRMERVLAHLESGTFSCPQLHGLMPRCELIEVQEAVAELVLGGKVEQAKGHMGKWRGWRLAPQFPSEGSE